MMSGRAARVPATRVRLMWSRALEWRLSPAQIGMADSLVRRQAPRLVGQDDAARLEAVAAVRHLEGHVGVLLDEQDRGALLVDLPDRAKDRGHELRREAEGRLVQQKDRRTGHERAADGEHLQLAAGQGPGLLAGALLQDREESEHFLVVLRDPAR